MSEQKAGGVPVRRFLAPAFYNIHTYALSLKRRIPFFVLPFWSVLTSRLYDMTRGNRPRSHSPYTLLQSTNRPLRHIKGPKSNICQHVPVQVSETRNVIRPVVTPSYTRHRVCLFGQESCRRRGPHPAAYDFYLGSEVSDDIVRNELELTSCSDGWLF